MSDQVLVGVCQSSLQSPRKFTQRGLDELSSRDNTLDLREEDGREREREEERKEAWKDGQGERGSGEERNM